MKCFTQEDAAKGYGNDLITIKATSGKIYEVVDNIKTGDLAMIDRDLKIIMGCRDLFPFRCGAYRRRVKGDEPPQSFQTGLASCHGKIYNYTLKIIRKIDLDSNFQNNLMFLFCVDNSGLTKKNSPLTNSL